MADNHQTGNAKLLIYNPQFDGLRFCAVFFVVSYHWLPSFSHLPVSNYIGGMINFFFVLSSYLITRILFSGKQKALTMNIPKYKVMAVFLLRRVIRIFPAYYLFLLLVLLLPVIGAEVKSHAGMYFSYLANYHMYNSPEFPEATPHLWTLSVEEQFYLVWPLIILFMPRKYLLKTFLLIILASVALRAIFYHPTHGVPQAILTQYCVDAFAVGGILAYKITGTERERYLISKYFTIAFYLAVPISISIILFKSQYFSFVANRLLFSIISMKLIENAITGYKGFFAKFLENKTVVYLGRISYGIYLYHLLMPILFWKVYDFVIDFMKTQHAGFYNRHHNGFVMAENFLVSEVVGFIIYAALVIAVASLSWRFLEQPINKLKISYSFDKKKAALKHESEAVG